MPNNEIVPYSTASPTVRSHRRDLARMAREAEKAEAKIEDIGRVTKRAMVETLNTNLVRTEAERIAPEGAEQYAMLAVAGTVEMAQVIARLNRPGR